MARTLYQYTTCPYSGKVRRMLASLDLDHDIVEVPRDDHGIIDGATVPVLDDGDQRIGDSQAIVQYLKETYG